MGKTLIRDYLFQSLADKIYVKWAILACKWNKVSSQFLTICKLDKGLLRHLFLITDQVCFIKKYNDLFTLLVQCQFNVLFFDLFQAIDIIFYLDKICNIKDQNDALSYSQFIFGKLNPFLLDAIIGLRAKPCSISDCHLMAK